MTLYVTRSIGCDALGCLNEWEGYPGERAAKIRPEALAAGWRRVGDQDYCPKHADGAPQPEAYR